MNMLLRGRALWSFLESCIFPDHCVGCGIEGRIICIPCKKNIPDRGMFFHTPDTPLHSLITLGTYTTNDILTSVIQDIKYGYIEASISVLEESLTTLFTHFSDTMARVDSIVPIPLHKKRYAARGFNQAHTIAKVVAKSSRKPMMLPLIRIRNTKQQALLQKEERKTNIINAFSVVPDSSIFGKHMLLVDDVYTTGATMNECAKVLSAAGAQSVSGFVLAKGE